MYKIKIHHSDKYGIYVSTSLNGVPEDFFVVNDNKKTITIDGERYKCISLDTIEKLLSSPNLTNISNEFEISLNDLPEELRIQRKTGRIFVQFRRFNKSLIRRYNGTLTIKNRNSNTKISPKMTFVIATIAIGSLLGVITIANYNDTTDIDDSAVVSTTDINTSDTDESAIDTNENYNYITIDLSSCKPTDGSIQDPECIEKVLSQVENGKTCEQIIKEYSELFGIDERIIIAMACQESGSGHDPNDTIGDIGQMQIRKGTWDGETLSVRDIYGNKVTEHITTEKLTSLEYNIKIGCMILRDYLNLTNNNLPLAIMCYNMGPGNMRNITNCEILKNIDQQDLSWLNNTRGHGGDPEYLQHVVEWLKLLDLDTSYTITTKNGEILAFDFNIQKVKTQTLVE